MPSLAIYHGGDQHHWEGEAGITLLSNLRQEGLPPSGTRLPHCQNSLHPAAADLPSVLDDLWGLPAETSALAGEHPYEGMGMLTGQQLARLLAEQEDVLHPDMLGQRGENGEDSDSDSEDLLIYTVCPDGSHGNTSVAVLLSPTPPPSVRAAPSPVRGTPSRTGRTAHRGGATHCTPTRRALASPMGGLLRTRGGTTTPRRGGPSPSLGAGTNTSPYGGTPISPTCLGGTPSWGGLLQAAYHDGSQGNTNSAADLLPVADDSCVTQSLGGPSEQGEVAGQAASGGTGQGRIEQAPEPSPADWLHLKVGLRAAALAGNSDMVRVMLRYLGEGVAFTLQDMVVSQIASVVASITNSTGLDKATRASARALLVQWDHQIAWSLLSDANEGAAWDPPLREPPSQICGGALAKEGARDKKAAKDKKGAKDKEGAPPGTPP
eukprot:gene32605-17623_t